MMMKLQRPYALLKTVSLFWVFVTTTSFANIPADQSEEASKLAPEKHHVRTSNDILAQLSQHHFRNQKINNEVSERVFEKYIKELDPTRSYFTQADMDRFEPHRFKLDDYFRIGNLGPAYNIYNTYQARLIERLTFMLNHLDGDITDIDFKKKETLTLDRETTPWAKDKAELDELWYKRLKNVILNLKLAGKELKEVQKTLIKRYTNQLNRAQQTNSEDVFQVYINSLTHTYDPHTQYFSPRSSENFNINMSLSLEGIGAVLQPEDEYTKVVRLVPAGPADKSGLLHPSDRIVGVGQGNEKIVDVIGWRLDEVVQLIRGPKNSVVRLEIIPSNSADTSKTKVIQLVRNTVKLEEQSAKKEVIDIKRGKNKDLKVGIIDIPTFYVDFKAQQENNPNYKSTTRDVARLIKELKTENVDGIIIDLRNNGGGSLQEANKLIGLFIQTGPTVQVKETNGTINILGDPDPDIAYRGPLAVLVNRLSASASEIFAGAIQDFQRGVVIGGQTFGKGTVQSLRPLNKGQLKITQAKFYRISGESTQHQGVIPDILYPQIYDHEKIGESAQPEALPWDTIPPARYKPYGNLTPFLSILRNKHAQRVKDNPDFKYLLKQIDLLKELGEQSSISLHEEQRKQERKEAEEKRLALENARLVAKGEEPLKSLESIDEEEESEEEDEKSSPDDDALLVETAEILIDMIQLEHQFASH